MSRPTILAVDDDQPTLDFIRHALEGEGYGVAVAASAAAAFERIVEEPPALILLDLRLPESDGWEVFNRVRALGLTIPVALMTVVQSAREEAERLGFDAFLPKPFSLEELSALVSRLAPREAAAGADGD